MKAPPWLTALPTFSVLIYPRGNESIGIKKVRNARGPHTLMKLSHRRQVPSESFVTMCPGLLVKPLVQRWYVTLPWLY